MKAIQTWDFLVSRNYILDYRTIVAPDFMCEARITSLLAQEADGQINPPDNPLYQKRVDNSPVGDLVLVYRVTEARSSYIGQEGAAILKDAFGREIDFVEGFVVRQEEYSSNLDNQVLEQWIDDSHQRIVGEFRNFWQWESPNSALPSRGINRYIDQFDLDEEQELGTPEKIEDGNPDDEWEDVENFFNWFKDVVHVFFSSCLYDFFRFGSRNK